MAEGDLLIEDSANLKFANNVDEAEEEEQEPNFDDPEDFIDDVDDEGVYI